MADILGALSLATTAAGRLWELSKQIEQLEAKELIVELRGQLVELKSQIVDVLDENVRLRQELAKAKQSHDAGDLVFRDNAYFSADGEGPFCQNCWDTQRRKVRLVSTQYPAKHFGDWKCQVCDKYAR